MSILFGPAGNSESFSAMGYKKNTDIPAYLAHFELTTFEYQCGRGVRISQEAAEKLGALAAESGITFSLHAPYYISMSSLTEETRLKSVDYILQSARAVKALGGRRVIFHSGSCGKQSREAALALALDTMGRMVDALDEAGLSDIVLCPEVMGKIGQLGTVSEVLALCGVDRRITPCVDFGHLNARTMGGLAKKADFAAVLDEMADTLGDERAVRFHAHFSKIEYTKGGEKRHLTFADEVYGPRYEPLMELCYERGLAPTIICESAGTQSEDAAEMQRYYRSLMAAG